MENYSELINNQRKYWNSGKTRSIKFRIEKLKLLKEVIKDNYDNIIKAVKQDFGKPEFEIYTTEIRGVLDEINTVIKKLNSWAKPKKVKTPITLFKAKSVIYREPFGCVLVITAWNYPFMLAMSPFIGAISAGNCCIIKPSEVSSKTSAIIANIISSIYDKEYCAVIEGGVDETTALLAQKFDFIHYTGSERIGKIIAESAAKNLTPLVLELGGKSPCIVDETVDIELTARRIVWGKYLNGGQTCVAPDYLLVHEKVKDQIINAIKKEIRLFYGDSISQNSDYCRIINNRHFDRLINFLNEGDIIIGGKSNRTDLFIEPTVIDNVKWTDSVMKEEIFGPILPVIVFSKLPEVIDTVNSHDKPLALYYFTKNKKRQKEMIKSVSFGGGCINATVMHTANSHLPFGGVGNSGMGNYHGKWSFETFSHKKSVLIKSLNIDIKLLYPPYRNKVKLLKKML